MEGAEKLFEDLAKLGETLESPGYPVELAIIPGVGRIDLGPVSVSGPPTIGARVPGIGIDEIEFPREA